MFGISGKQRQPARCIIKINGDEIAKFYRYLEQVSVETSRKNAAICTLTFASVRDEKGEWNIQDSGLFEPWNRITIEADFGSKKEEIMRGFIRDVKADYPNDMNASVRVTGQDETILLDRKHIKLSYKEDDGPYTDMELVKELLRDHWEGSPQGKASKMKIVPDKIGAGMPFTALQFDGRPIHLIKDRATLNGYEFYIRKGEPYFGEPKLEGDPQPVILIYAGMASNCHNFSVSHDGHIPDSINFVDVSEPCGETTEEVCESIYALLGETPANSKNKGLSDFMWRIPLPRGATLAERKARAQAIANEAAWKIRATGELDGSAYGHVLETNRTVTVNGAGSTYDGLWYVDEVKHHFSTDGYRQTFRLVRNAVKSKSAGLTSLFADPKKTLFLVNSR
ncbi:MAG: hypothetical protein FWH56_06140 [Betaproteobacteria bacterium]|nr:hypothetical protein [Betaproteobacteria bacterium]